ncbi:MAG: hypothetical protein H7039_13335 [Bryobacteraceae bacterium]|nr:hypothetical protein [Bryobacteraceae bacterium]
MFTWICPKCGSEVPPSYSDCPRCAAANAQTPLVQDIPAPVRNSTASTAPPVQVTQPVRPAPDPEPPQAPLPPQQPAYIPQNQYIAPTQYVPQSQYVLTEPRQETPTPEPYRSTAGMYAPAAVPARSTSPTLVALGAALGIVALLAILYIWILPKRGSATSATAADAQLEAPVAASTGSNPLTKHLEVTGVRIQEAAGGKVKIDFVVVNHSPADLPDLKLQVRLGSGDRDFFVVPVNLPTLGPFDSKDLSTTVKTNLRSYELPDWQLVKARFSIVGE